MKADQPVASTVIPWLRENLGKAAVAMLTSTDRQALQAAVHIVSLWNYADEVPSRALPAAFRACVLCMQESTREFAYHAIAHVGDWHTRDSLWARAGLPPLEQRMMCRHEPKGGAA